MPADATRQAVGLTLPTLGRALLRVMPGPQDEWFQAGALSAVSGVSFRISPRSNRMGYRLEGPPLARVRQRELISEITPEILSLIAGID